MTLNASRFELRRTAPELRRCCFSCATRDLLTRVRRPPILKIFNPARLEQAFHGAVEIGVAIIAPLIVRQFSKDARREVSRLRIGRQVTLSPCEFVQEVEKHVTSAPAAER